MNEELMCFLKTQENENTAGEKGTAGGQGIFVPRS